MHRAQIKNYAKSIANDVGVDDHIDPKNQTAITLIALVITIIVLLILAGVALSLVMGENGITERAVNAGKTQNIAGAVEKVELEIANLASEFYQAKYVNNSLPDGVNTVGDYVLAKLQNGDGYTVTKGTGANAGKITVTISDGTSRTGTIGSDGKVAWEGVEYGNSSGGGGETPVANPTDPIGVATHTGDYGKIVTGYTGYTSYNESDVWRLFYADSNNAYLIKNSIGNYSLNNSTLFPDFSTVTGETISTLGKNLNTDCSATFWRTNPSYYNKKGTAVLTNIDNFVNYKNSYANWALGAPSLEMFIASYNATHTASAISAYKANGHSSETLTQTQLACDVENDTDYGYKVKKGSEAPNTYTSGLGNTSALDQGIYCPSSGYWWLASPSAGYSSNVMYVSNYNSGSLNNDDYSYPDGVRPLVSIPVSKIGNGITVTNNY